jgi:hypothetical protein
LSRGGLRLGRGGLHLLDLRGETRYLGLALFDLRVEGLELLERSGQGGLLKPAVQKSLV